MDGWMDGWMGGWVDVKAGLRIAYSNKKIAPFTLGLLRNGFFDQIWGFLGL